MTRAATDSSAEGRTSGGALEWLTRSAARARASKVDPAARESLATALRAARQRAEAADTLWSSGHPAEGLRLLADAVTLALALVTTDDARTATSKDTASADTISEDIASAERAEPPWVGALSRRGLAPDRIRAIQRVAIALEAATLPTFDDELGPAHAQLFRELGAAWRSIEASLQGATLTPSQLGRSRVARVALVVLLAMLAMGGLAFALYTPDRTEALASAVFGSRTELGPDNVIDGDRETEWILPDEQEGWVEVLFDGARRVERVRLLNAHNRFYNDRATKDYALEIYRDGEVIQTIEGSFEFEAHPELVEHAVGQDRVDRIRFVVRTWHHQGGGLAELTWE